MTQRDEKTGKFLPSPGEGMDEALRSAARGKSQLTVGVQPSEPPIPSDQIVPSFDGGARTVDRTEPSMEEILRDAVIDKSTRR